MKYFYKIINAAPGHILLPCILLLAGSCEKQPTDYRSFLEGQEIVYPAAASQIESGPGKYRVLLKWKRNPDPSITEYIIYWNNNRDSTIVETASNPSSDTIKVAIGDLDEGMHNFTIYSFDQEGNKSIPVILENVKVYGDKYQGSLLNRAVSSVSYTDGKLILTWSEPDTINVHTEVKYTNLADEVQTFLVPADSSRLVIPDWKLPTKIFYRSTYKPEKEAIDTFTVPEYDSVAVPL